MKILNIKEPIWIVTERVPFGQMAMTLWPFILITPEANKDECIRKHEEFHWYHAKRWGVLAWYVAYLVLGLFYMGKPANEHPLEKPAYDAEAQCRGRERW